MTGTLELELVCDGLQFPEGPIWMLDGSIVLVEIKAKRLSRVAADGGYSVMAQLEGGPNGAAIGPDGMVYVCNNGGMKFIDFPDGSTGVIGAADDHIGGSIQCIDPTTGVVTTLYTESDGLPLRSPNDLVFDAHGGFWFTDLGRHLEHSRDDGAIHYACADGSQIRCVRRGLHAPNGIGLAPGGAELYVAETPTSRIWRHPIPAPGTIENNGNMWQPGEVLGPLPGYQLLDSMAVEANGNICAATLINGGITVFTLGGETTFHAVPDLATTNLCFGGGDMRDVWITASTTGRLYKTRWPRPGLRLEHYA